jgi:hypothetical protein
MAGCSQPLTYSSESEPDSDCDDEQPQKKKRKILDWILVKAFRTKNEAKQFLKDEDLILLLSSIKRLFCKT